MANNHLIIELPLLKKKATMQCGRTQELEEIFKTD